MVHSYQEYLAEPKALTLEEMQEIHGEIAGEIGSDADGMELYDELMAVAVRYASIRAGWPLLSREVFMEIVNTGDVPGWNVILTVLSITILIM